MKKLLGALSAFLVIALIGCMPAYAIEPEATADIIETVGDVAVAIAPGLPVWAQITIALVGGLFGLFTSVVRPQIPPEKWDKLGKTGEVLDVVAGNRKHTKNAPQADPLDKKKWPKNH